jgi:hypothetical protein
MGSADWIPGKYIIRSLHVAKFIIDRMNTEFEEHGFWELSHESFIPSF